MRIISAIDDFMERSVRSVDGALEKLRFVARLRKSSEQSSYEHWGMSKTYGEQEANKAMAEAHSRVWIDILRTPIQNLESDVRGTKYAQQVGSERYLNELAEEAKAMPANLKGGSKRHFGLVLKTLRMLVQGKNSPSK